MQKVIVANWKMNKTICESIDFIDELAPLLHDVEAKVLIAPPFTSLAYAANRARHTSIMIGAQNIDFHFDGAYTGEISATMVKEAGAQFVILGHSERRNLFHETSEVVNLKVKAALIAGLIPLVCIGETQEQRLANQVESTLKMQLLASLADLQPEQFTFLMIAYEPVWAIGTGLAASPRDVFHAHHFCRQVMAECWGEAMASKMPLLYGGSVKAENARELLETKDVDGLLVGGASLSVQSFSKIVFAQQALNFS